MGSAEITDKEITISSNIITYGDAADAAITERIRNEIEVMWNEPGAVVAINGIPLRVVFNITAEWQPGIPEIAIYSNLDPVNNYFRIEHYADGNISFVDGIGSNSGYFLYENLYPGSTTAAHEYGHTLGLDHPHVLDIRGRGQPGIMYPRGTLVDPAYQYEPDKQAGTKGGTLHPRFRKVLPEDVQALRLNRYRYNNNKTVVGGFTNVWHGPDER